MCWWDVKPYSINQSWSCNTESLSWSGSCWFKAWLHHWILVRVMCISFSLMQIKLYLHSTFCGIPVILCNCGILSRLISQVLCHWLLPVTESCVACFRGFPLGEPTKKKEHYKKSQRRYISPICGEFSTEPNLTKIGRRRNQPCQVW